MQFLRALLEDADLEQYRQHAVDMIEYNKDAIKQIAQDVLDVDQVTVRPIGSVTDPDRFTEHSDIDIGVYLSPNADHINERLSEILQMEMIKHPFGDLGVLNTIVYE